MKEWTIMVYMAGDNNLNVEMVYALEQLKEGDRILVKNEEIIPAVTTRSAMGQCPGHIAQICFAE